MASEPDGMGPSAVDRTALAEAEATCLEWKNQFVRWMFLHWFLIASLSIGSAFVASDVVVTWDFAEKHNLRNIIALYVAACGSILAIFQPQIRANAFRAAWLKLRFAIKEARGWPSTLLAAELAGENLITRGQHAEGVDNREAKRVDPHE
jgi:hypothetical protein